MTKRAERATVEVANAGLNKSGKSVIFETAGLNDKLAMRTVGLKVIVTYADPAYAAKHGVIGYRYTVEPILAPKPKKAAT